MANIIVSLTLLVIIGLAIYKIILEKRSGKKCVGCHLSGECSSKKATTDKLNFATQVNGDIAIKELT